MSHSKCMYVCIIFVCRHPHMFPPSPLLLNFRSRLPFCLVFFFYAKPNSSRGRHKWVIFRTFPLQEFWNCFWNIIFLFDDRNMESVIIKVKLICADSHLWWKSQCYRYLILFSWIFGVIFVILVANSKF